MIVVDKQSDPFQVSLVLFVDPAIIVRLPSCVVSLIETLS